MYSKKKKIRQHDVVYDNTTRDSIPKRGYYSELVSDMSREDPSKDVCARKRMKLILQVLLQERSLSSFLWDIVSSFLSD